MIYTKDLEKMESLTSQRRYQLGFNNGNPFMKETFSNKKRNRKHLLIFKIRLTHDQLKLCFSIPFKNVDIQSTIEEIIIN